MEPKEENVSPFRNKSGEISHQSLHLSIEASLASRLIDKHKTRVEIDNVESIPEYPSTTSRDSILSVTQFLEERKLIRKENKDLELIRKDPSYWKEVEKEQRASIKIPPYNKIFFLLHSLSPFVRTLEIKVKNG